MPTQSTFKSCVPIQIRFSDVDLLGHVSNTQYQNYFDLGKTDYFAKVLPEIDFSGLCVVGASVKIDYILPVFMHSKVVVKTRIVKVGTKSMTLEHQIAGSGTDEVYATCTVVLVCFHVKEQISYPIPEEWKRKISAFEGF